MSIIDTVEVALPAPGSVEHVRPTRTTRWAGVSTPFAGRPNQDCWLGAENFWVVADGMGGLENGAESAQRAVELFASSASSTEPQGVVAAVSRIDATIARQSEVAGRSGTTIAAAVLIERRLVVAHVGDSRVYRLRRGLIRQLTQDHSVRELALGAGAGLDGLTRSQQAGLTSFLGKGSQGLQIGVRTIAIEEGDAYVLCTDGVHGKVPPAQLARCLGNPDPLVAAEDLVEIALTAGTTDDATAVVIRFDRPAHD